MKCGVCKKEKDEKKIIKKIIFRKQDKLIIEYICKSCKKAKWNKFYDEYRE